MKDHDLDRWFSSFLTIKLNFIHERVCPSEEIFLIGIEAVGEDHHGVLIDELNGFDLASEARGVAS